jgi:hypothetical protein
MAQIKKKQSKSKKMKAALSCGWERALVDFSARSRTGGFYFARRKVQTAQPVFGLKMAFKMANPPNNQWISPVVSRL